jgi:hypothetical protein
MGGANSSVIIVYGATFSFRKADKTKIMGIAKFSAQRPKTSHCDLCSVGPEFFLGYLNPFISTLFEVNSVLNSC